MFFTTTVASAAEGPLARGSIFTTTSVLMVDGNGDVFSDYGGGFPSFRYAGWNAKSLLKTGVYPGGDRYTIYSYSLYVVGNDGNLYKNGQKVSFADGVTPKWKTGTFYTPKLSHKISDSLGNIYDLDTGKQVPNIKTAPNASLGYRITDSSGIIWDFQSNTVKAKENDYAAKLGLKIKPNQYGFMAGNGFYLVDDTGKLMFIKNTDYNLSKTFTGVSGLTPGTIYDGDDTIVDGAGDIWGCPAGFEASCWKVNAAAKTNLHLTPGTHWGNAISPNDSWSSDQSRIFYATGPDHKLYYWYYQDSNVGVKGDWKLIPGIQVTPGQMVVASIGDRGNNLMVLDETGVTWRLMDPMAAGGSGRIDKVPALAGASDTVDDKDCTAVQLPQSGDPAASYRQLVPWFVAVLGVVSGVFVAIHFRRRAYCL